MRRTILITVLAMADAAVSMDSAIKKWPSPAILLPLYIWPTNDFIWEPVYTAAELHPKIQFQVIINPDSGPGYTEFPATSYITAVARLNTYDNVFMLGYIPTYHASRDISDVRNDIMIYSGWACFKNQNIALSGIFFDEAPNTNEQSSIHYMTKISNIARDHHLSTVIFNPGTKLEEGSVNAYFEAADLIVEFENSYSTWTNTAPADRFSLAKDHYKDAVLLYDVSLDTDYYQFLREAKQLGLGAVYLTNNADYKSLHSISIIAAMLTKAL
ncbi:CAZyme family GH135 [Penicillium frequentans]|uniref:CAZyme family GH135 n=1 Tax=Penicillium frequentans TaxID=3151616 RepID=A0AAD6CH53_9EURO|nr:CAZyme family GH135 [Penicillium glabrum]KAJ5522879.1 CAZyme family GH135 [Penicillium glabrum]KAJ5522954.1 CAZyme family GH135 [Penicillium glabrum]